MSRSPENEGIRPEWPKLIRTAERWDEIISSKAKTPMLFIPLASIDSFPLDPDDNDFPNYIKGIPLLAMPYNQPPGLEWIFFDLRRDNFSPEYKPKFRIHPHEGDEEWDVWAEIGGETIGHVANEPIPYTQEVIRVPTDAQIVVMGSRLGRDGVIKIAEGVTTANPFAESSKVKVLKLIHQR